MSFTRNGNSNGRPTVRYRLDGRAGTLASLLAPESGYSGRRLVVAGVATILALWGLLYLMFVVWRSDYRQRTQYGIRAVLPALDPLARARPPGISPADWDETIAETRAMVARITGSGALDLPQMQALRTELAERAARTTPQTAVSELLGLWADLEARAGPLLADTAYPRLLAPGLIAGRLVRIVPSGIEPAQWSRAVGATQGMLVAVAGSGELTPVAYEELVKSLSHRVDRARAGTALEALRKIWNDASSQAPRALRQIPRPSLLEEPDSGHSTRP